MVRYMQNIRINYNTFKTQTHVKGKIENYMAKRENIFSSNFEICDHFNLFYHLAPRCIILKSDWQAAGVIRQN